MTKKIISTICIVVLLTVNILPSFALFEYTNLEKPVMTMQENQIGDYEFNNSQFKSTFKRNITENGEYIRLELSENQILSYKFLGQKPTGVEVADNKITYKNPFPNTDIEYLVKGNSIKENIIVNKPQTEYKYPLAIDLIGDIDYQQNSDGTLAIINKNKKQIAKLGGLIAYDSKGLQTNNIKLELTKQQDHSVITVSLEDETFLKNAEFPITIDPTVSVTSRILVKRITDCQETVSQIIQRNYQEGSITTAPVVTEEQINSDITLVDITEGSIEEIIAALLLDSQIEIVQNDYLLTTHSEQDMEKQWYINNVGQEVQGVSGSSGADINFFSLWQETRGENITIALLDTGVDINHQDLTNNIYINTAEIPDNGIDDDGNGYIDDYKGWDFFNKDKTVYDVPTEDQHGTHLAGLIAAKANDLGIIGVAPETKILPIKIMSGDSGYTSDAIRAINYAEQMGVNIINCSFGSADYSPLLQETIEKSSMLFICSTGNSGNDLVQNPEYPASFDLPNILAVSASNNLGLLSDFSNYGIGEIIAPGEGIYSTLPANQYGYLSGTSQATAIVTGVAALLQSTYDEDILKTKARIEQGARIEGDLKFLDGSSAYLNEPTIVDLTEVYPGTNPVGVIPEDEVIIKGLDITVDSGLLKQAHYGEKGVNPTIGNYSRTDLDFSLDVPGFTLNISRTYNSLDKETDGPLGPGWHFGFDSSLSNDGQITTVKLPNGSIHIFQKNADGTYEAWNSLSRLEKQNDQLVLTTKDQYKYYFNSSNYLVRMEDRFENGIDIHVDEDGKIHFFTDEVGRFWNITYNGHNKIDKVKDPIGREVSYSYDDDGNLVQIDLPEGKIQKFEYNSDGYLSAYKLSDGTTDYLIEELTYLTEVGSEGKVETFRDENNNTFSYTYDEANKLTTIIDSNSRVVRKWYDDSYYITTSQDPEGKKTWVSYYLDENGKNRLGITKTITDRNGNTTRYLRDQQGNITKKTYSDGSYEEFEYDSKNNLILERDQMGRKTYYIYDTTLTYLQKKVKPLDGNAEFNHLSDLSQYSITTYDYYDNQYSAKGLLKSEIDPMGYVTTYTYDQFGNQESVTDQLNNKITYNYNKIGWLTSMTDAKGYTTYYVYNNAGLLLKKITAGGEVIRYTYDKLGRKTKEIGPELYDPALDELTTGSGNDYTGDHGYRFSWQTEGNPWIKTTVIDPEGNTTFYKKYDVYGNLLEERLPHAEPSKPHVTYRYKYDVMNRKTQTQFQESPMTVPEVLANFGYSIKGNGLRVEEKTNYLNNNEKAVTTYVYDFANRLIEQRNPNGGVQKWLYNPDGSLQSIMYPEGETKLYSYNGLGLKEGEWHSVEPGLYSYIGYKYDVSGRKIEVLTSSELTTIFKAPEEIHKTTYSYNAINNIISIVKPGGGKALFEYDRSGNKIAEIKYTSEKEYTEERYTYNHFNKITEKTQYVYTEDLNVSNDRQKTQLRTTYSYDKNGNLVKITDPEDRETYIEYDNLGNPVKTTQSATDEFLRPKEKITTTLWNAYQQPLEQTDALGNVTKSHYNGRGKLTFIEKTANGTEIIAAYQYDRGGRRILEVQPENFTGTLSSTNLETMNHIKYTYDVLGQLTKKEYIYNIVTDTDGNITSSDILVDESIEYDLSGRRTYQQDGEGYLGNYGIKYTYNLAGKLSSICEPDTASRGEEWTTKYAYDGMKRLTSVSHIAGPVNNTYYDVDSNIIRKALQTTPYDEDVTLSTAKYNLAGQLIESSDANGNKTTYEYNAFGKLRSTTLPGDESIAANTISYIYTKNGQVVEALDSTGRMQIYNYDELDRVISLTTQQKDGSDAVTVETRYDLNNNIRFNIDGNGYVTEHQYDELNRELGVYQSYTAADDTKVTHSAIKAYDKNNNLLVEKGIVKRDINEYIVTKSYEYDTINRLIATKEGEGGTALVIEKLSYDNSHKQIKSEVINTAGDGFNTTAFTYDKNNRLVSTTDPLGNIVSKEYDISGNVIFTTDGNGYVTRRLYDEFNNLTMVVDPYNNKTKYSYDLNGNLLTQTDGLDHTASYEYNARNLLAKQIDHGGREEDNGEYIYKLSKVESYVYDANGRLIAKTDRNGNTIENSYDVHGNILSEKTGSLEVLFSYDGNGNVLTMTDSTGVTAYAYDELGRTQLKYAPNFGAIKYEYDLIENGKLLTSTTDTEGNTVFEVFGEQQRLVEVRDGTDITTYSYYANGSKQTVTYPDNRKEEYGYTTNGQLAWLDHYDSTSTLQNANTEGRTYSYHYDSAGNQLKAIDINGETVYEYDRLSRLSTVTEPDNTVTTYTFDLANNRTEKTVTKGSESATTSYEYNEQNRLLKETTKDSLGNIKNTVFKYDPNGNVIYQSDEILETVTDTTPEASFGMFIIGQGSSEELDYGLRLYTFDGFNRLVEATANGDKAVYEYDGVGRRVSKSVNGVKTNYLYTGDRIVLEKAGNGEVTRNIYGSTLIAREDSSDKALYSYDGHGDVVGLFVQGVLRAKYEYDAFGNTKVEKYYDAAGTEVPQGLVKTPYRYNGYEYDEETGNYFLKARYYNPAIGRFISEDSYRGKIEFVLSLNLYTYCNNEPIMYWDPSGHVTEEDKKYDEKTQEALQKLTDGYFSWHKKVADAETEEEKQRLRGIRDTYSKMADAIRSYNDGPETEKNKDESITARDIKAEIQETTTGNKRLSTNTSNKTSASGSDKGSNVIDTEEITILTQEEYLEALGGNDGYKSVVVEVDPEMTWDQRIDHFVDGSFKLGIGGTAIVAGTAVITGGLSLVPTAIGYVTVLAGGITTLLGTAEIGEGITGGHNYIRDDVMGGNDWAYYMTDTASTLVATGGTIYCAYAKDIDMYLSGKNKNAETSKNDWIYNKGYKPKEGERTLEGFVNNNVSIDKEISLHTNSSGFNSNPRGTGGQFKRFGTDSHGGVKPHVHQPIRNIAPNGSIYGGTGSKTSNGGVTSPTTKDVKQLYDYLFNDKYRP